MAGRAGEKAAGILAIVALFGCAHQLPPSGGEEDKTPPEIVETYPRSGTVNFDDDRIELTFSEYVQKRSLPEAVFVSPAIEGGLEYEWSGKSVEILLPEDLREDATYTFTVGTDLVDYNNNNRMASAFQLVFSTGAELANGAIDGTVRERDPSGVMIYAYMTTDSANYLSRKPDYVSQAGDDGSYRLRGLNPGTYRVYAVDDEFRDLLFQADQDRVGLPSRDPTISREDSLAAGLDFFLIEYDTTAPEFASATMTDSFHAVAEFTEPIDSSAYDPAKFWIVDSSDGARREITYAYRGRSTEDQVALAFRAAFPDTADLHLWTSGVSDVHGNESPPLSAPMMLSDKPDTAPPTIVKSLPSNKTNVPFKSTELEFYFNDGFDLSALAEGGVALIDTGGAAVPVTMTKIDDAAFRLTAREDLKKNSTYYAVVDLGRVEDVAGNVLRDSIAQTRLKTLNPVEQTGVSGKVLNADLAKSPILVIEEARGGIPRHTAPLEGEEFSFMEMSAGKYRLWLFYDLDGSGDYSPGAVEPFAYAEPAFFFPKDIDVPPRWAVTDVTFIVGAKWSETVEPSEEEEAEGEK
jgi:uncharacterized protein (DUF2141 family)